MDLLQELLSRSAARHDRLCPRQVLGVRLGLLAGKVLNLNLPQTEKRLFAFVECDGCGMGGIAIATGCFVERRTMRVLDYGKLAATFVDLQTDQSVRIKPNPECREIANQFNPENLDRWHSQLEAYQSLSDEELFIVEPVQLRVSLDEIISQPNLRVACAVCGEEIINQRQVMSAGKVICRSCAGDSYFSWEIEPTVLQNHNQLPIPLLTVIGKSKSGKTTLIKKLVKELSERGYRLATVKHHSHPGFEIDVPGKDSWQFALAGSHQVVIASPDKFATYWKLDHEMSLDEIAAEIHDVDLILAEGYKKANKPSLEVLRATNSTELIGSTEQRVALVSDLRLEVGVPRFDLNDLRGISGFVEERFIKRRG